MADQPKSPLQNLAKPVGPFTIRICNGCGQQVNEGHHAHGGKLSPVYDLPAEPTQAVPTAKPETFAEALERHRLEKRPVMAVRLDSREELDDLVIESPAGFHAEMMSDDLLWMAVRFANGEEAVFHVSVYRDKPRGRARLRFDASDLPDHVDWDDLFHRTRGAEA